MEEIVPCARGTAAWTSGTQGTVTSSRTMRVPERRRLTWGRKSRTILVDSRPAQLVKLDGEEEGGHGDRSSRRRRRRRRHGSRGARRGSVAASFVFLGLAANCGDKRKRRDLKGNNGPLVLVPDMNRD